VTVQAELSGAFELTVAVDASTGSSTCMKSVTINAGTNCMICCRESVYGNSAPVPFAATGVGGATLAWSVTGNGTIVGSATSFTVNVKPGPAADGPFTLSVTATAPTFVRSCSREIAVLEPGPPPPNQNRDAKIMLHVVRSSPIGCDLGGCRDFAARIPCTSAITRAELYPKLYYAAVLVAKAESDGGALSGVSGAHFGIDYQGGATGAGIDIFGWTLFAQFEYRTPDWPAPGSGNRIVPLESDACFRQEPGGPGTGVSAQLGFFYLSAYTPDSLAITPHPTNDLASVIDCYLREWPVYGAGAPGNPYPLGSAVFSASGTAEGYNPCDAAVTIVPTTWSRIKNLLPAAKPRTAGGG
jgi:hypothetical protein